MANDKKFIVKNGLLTPENAVIGSTTDTGEKLQVTGDSVLTQAVQGTPTLKVTNSGGHSASTIIAQFEGDSDSLQIRNISAGDYKITNPQQDNSISFYDGTAGIVINYAGTEIAAFTSTGVDFTGLATTTIEGNRILTTADEGSGNNLDADTVDGLEASQFLRSDVDDTAAGNIFFSQDIDVTGSAQIDTNITIDGQAVIKALLDAQANAQVAGSLTIGGDLTVSGNTTYVNTEEILLSDNIITLNANYTGSAPSENAGIEVERGTLANPKLVWNESQDYWQLEVNNAVLGRVITTADEGSGNGFDADTVDGLEAAQFLRSDADDTATGNITIEGDITVGDGNGAAQINFATSGQDRVLYGNNGTIGFLKNDNSGWNASSDTDGDWNVDRDVDAGRDVLADNDVTAGQDITATAGNISATAGSVSAGTSVTAGTSVAAGTTVTGGTGVTATTGNVTATAGDVVAGDDVIAGDDITATAGDITASAGNIAAPSGSVAAGTTVTAGTSVSAGTTVTGGTGVTATTGDVTATAGNVRAAEDVYGKSFIDVDNNSYVLNPHGTSTLNDVGIDDDLFHNGDTNTKLNFTTDQIKLNTGGTTRLDINNSRVLSNLDTYVPNLYVNDAIVHNNDTDTKINFATDNVKIDTGGTTRVEVLNTGVNITGDLDVSGDITAVNGTFTGDLAASRFLDADNNAYYADPNSTSVMNRIGIDDYIQHNGDTNTFLGFDSNDNIIFTTAAVERFEINATNITGTVDAIFPNVYAGTFYDLNNATYYVNPAGNSRMSGIGLVGTIFHDGDTDTYLNFNGANSFEVVTGNAQRLLVNDTYVLANNQMRSPIFYDSNNTNYYGNFASTSQMAQIDIDTYIRHRGDTNNYFGFDAADSQTFVTGGVERLNITDANSTFSHPVIVQGDVQADRFVDRNATGYFVHPGDTTLAATFAGAVRIENIANNSRWADTTGNGGIALMGYGDGNGSTSNPSIAISGNVSGGYALQYMNLIDSSANPAGNGQRYIHFYHDGVDGGSIRGDSSGNLYQVLKSGTTWGFWNSGYTEALIVDDNVNVMIANSSAPTYTVGDNTPVVGGALTTNRLHVGGSIQLAGSDDAIVIGRGTATFLKDEELGFGWGGGWYMTDGTYLRSRNNKHIYTTGAYYGNVFYSYQNTAYYADPDGDSQFNTVDIDDWVRHRGDTNTYIGFPAADQIELTTGGIIRGQINNGRIRFRNKLEVYGSGIELQKPTNGGGVGITMTDQSGELAGLAGLQQASIKVWHADNSVTTGAGLAMVFDSSEASTHYVFGESNGTVGATVIPRVNAQGNLGLPAYRWGNSYITSGDFVNLTVTNEIQAPGVSGYANYLKSRDNRIIEPNEDTAGRLRFGFTSWNNNNTAPWADYLHFRSYTDSSGGSDNLLMVKKSGLGMRLWQQTWNSGTAYSNFVDFPLYNVNPGTGNDFYADKFIDTNNTAYFADPAGESRLATIKLEDGVILRSPNGTFGSLTVSGTGRSGYEGFSINDRVVFMHNNANTSGIYNDVNNHWLFRGENGGVTAMYYNGSQQGSAENGYFLGQNQLRSPIYYDSGNTGYYVDAASTTRLNAVQALRYYFNHATTYYADAASGNYGSMEVGGYKSGWAGYSIAGQWVLMSNGPERVGIYNDTDNEWSQQWYRNAGTLLYYNGTQQAETANGYFLANNQMRAPIYYDSNDTTYYLNPAAGNTSRGLMTNGRIYRQGFDTSGNGDTNKVIEAQDYSHWIWNTAGNWGTFWAGNNGAAYQHFGSSNPNEYVFVGSGNVRASIDLDDGNAYFQGTVSAGNFALSGGNENISLNPAYGSGGADLVLFDMTPYMEARVIQNIDDNENNLTGTTSEYVKGDGPFAGGYVLRTSAYRNFYSNYIPVSPGEDIYGEISTRLISGSGGLLYYGVERFDKDKKPIAGNTGTTYFVVGGSNRTSTSWETLRNHTTMPTSHTPYNGSDGGGVHYVRIRILLNYNSGGALREYGGIMLKRRNAESNLLVDDLRVSDQLNVDGNAFITGDLTVDDITADVIDANIFRDRGNTAYYIDPASTGTSVNVRGVIQNPSIWINDGNEVNSYNENIRLFNASNGVSVIAFSATGTAGAPATSILGYSDRLETRRVNDWQQRTYAGRSEFVGDIRPTLMYDRNDTSYYLDPNSNGRMWQLGIGYRAAGKRLDVTGDHGNTAIRLALNAPQNGNGTGEWALQAWVSEPGRTWEGAGFGYNVDNNLNANTNQYYLGRPNTIGGQAYMRFERDGHTVFYNTNTSGTRYTSMSMYSSNYITVGNYLQAANSLRAPIFYDSNDTNYYANPASNSRFNTMQFVGDVNFDGGAGAIEITSSDIRSNGNSNWTGNPGSGVGKIQMHSNRWYIVSNGNSNRIVQFRQDGSDKSYIANDGRLHGVGGTGSQDWRAPIFYDSNDTSYYANPNGTSQFSTMVLRGNRLGFVTTAFDAEIRVTDNNPDGTGATFVLYGDGVAENAELATEVFRGSRHMRSPRYYDLNNASYYGDFASTSYMNDVRANIFYERENTAYYFGSSQGDARFRDTRVNNLRVENGVTIESVNGNGRIYLGGNLHIDAQNSNDIYLNYYSGRRTRMYAPGQVEAARLDTNRIFYAFYDFRAPIFYDYNDTTYRVDPNGTSVLRRLTINESLNGYLPDNFGRFRWSTGYFNNGTSTANFIGDLGDNEALSTGFTAQKVPWSYAGNSDVNTGITSIEMAGSSLATWHDGSYYTTLVIRPTTGNGGGAVYIYNNQGGGYSPGWRQVATSSTDFYNYNSLRSPIFYDINNTGFYTDPASTSILQNLTIGNYGTISLRTQSGNVRGYIQSREENDAHLIIATSGNEDISFRDGGTSGTWNQIIRGNGQVLVASRFDTPIMYDRNNTGFYVDPDGASNFNVSVRANEVYARNWFRNDNSGEGLYNQATAMHWYSDSSSRFRLYSTSSTSQILFTTSGNNARGYVYATNSNEIGFLNSGGSWSLRIDNSGNSFHSASARAPIFYDNNDTGYYLDPNSTSNAALRIRGGALHGPNPSWGRYLAVGTNGRYNNEASVATTNGNLHLDSRSGNNLYLQWYVGGTTFVNGSVQANIYYDRDDTAYYGNFASTSYMNDVRANIFYDRNNTAYYFGSGSGDSRFNTTTVGNLYNYNWFRNYNAGQGLYNQATGRHFYSPGSTYWHLDGASGSGGLIIYSGYNGSQGASGNRRGYLYYDSGGFGLLHSGGGWAFRISPGSTSTEQFGVSYMNDARAYIYYDRNNTAYYFDGASLRSTRFEGVSNRTMAHMNLPGHTRNSGEFYRSRAQRTSDTNYWTGAMGWSRVDMNVVSTWGSGFIDSWSSPPNQPSGTSHWVGTQAFHYRNSNTSGYGWQMVGGPIENLRFRSSWPTWRSWRTIPMLDVNNGNGGAMYAGIYYDSNNTGYYMNPASTSYWSTSQQNGYHTFLNYGVGVTGTYTSTRLQCVFAMGSSYRPNSAGTSAANMYGIAWSHPNAGSLGGANQLSDHGMLIINNGSWRAAIGPRIVCRDDMRATLFYDRNNTGYYVDPASTSNLYQINVPGNQIIIQGSSPTLYMRDVNHYTSMVHQNSNVFYVLSGRSNNTTSWSTYNGYWPMTLSMVNNDCQLGGNLRARYNVIAYSSDERLKTNIKPIENALEKLCTLRGVTFDWTDEAGEAGFHPEQKYNDVGVLAQEVEKVLPQLVMPAPFDLHQGNPDTEYVEGELSQAELLGTSKSGKNYKTVEYGRMVALTIEAIKEQQTIINKQQQEISDLKDMVSELVKKLS